MKPVVVEGMLGCRHHAFLFVSLFVALGIAFGVRKSALPAPVGDGSMGPIETMSITIVAALVWVALALRFLPPTGRVELDDAGVDFGQRGRFLWSAFESFDDGSTDAVALIRREGARLQVPTPNDSSRRAVLEVLETRLPRRSDS